VKLETKIYQCESKNFPNFPFSTPDPKLDHARRVAISSVLLHKITTLEALTASVDLPQTEIIPFVSEHKLISFDQR
jgi:hypothetical protein